MSQELVNHPSHYNRGSIEAIDVIEDWDLNFNLGSLAQSRIRLQYLSRNSLSMTNPIASNEFFSSVTFSCIIISFIIYLYNNLAQKCYIEFEFPTDKIIVKFYQYLSSL